MNIRKRVRATATALLILLLIVSAFMGFSKFTGSTADASVESANVNAIAGYGDLLKYEWPQFQGDSSFTRFSSGPAPEAPDIMWKTNVNGVQSYVTAFSGKVFVATNRDVYALNRETGVVLWNTTIPAPGRWPVVYKIDETHLVIGNSSLDVETGRILWNSSSFSANAATFAAGTYSSQEKTFFVKSQSMVQGWNFSDPSIPPKLEWATYVSGGGSVGSGVQYGDGKVFSGSFEPHQVALNATTGEVLWDTETTSGMLFSGSYYQGKFFRGGPFDNTLYAFNATTGQILWKFNPETHDGYWCSGTAVAYGMVYELNKDGHLYAVDADTGKLVWKYKGPGPLFFPGNPVVADGKVYATTGQNASVSNGVRSKSEFACVDAYTGQLIWTMPIEAFSPRESIAIAYGNLYIVPGYIKELEMDDYFTINQVWAIGTKDWPMWRHDPEQSAAGQSGPANLTLRWKFMTEGGVASSPSVAEERVYFGSQDKNVYSIDARNGALIWKFKTNARIVSSPAIVDGRVYVGPDDGNVYCINAYNGSLIWSTPAGGYVQANFASAVMLRSSPIVANGLVYVGSLDTKLYCIDAENGVVKWTYTTKGYITSSPAIAAGIVYVVSQEPSSGGLYMLNAMNGELIRRINLPYQLAARGTDMHSSVAVTGDMIFAASNKRVYYGINASSGNFTWTFRDDDAEEFIIASPIYNDGKVFLVDQFLIVALDAFNGSLLWKTFLGTEFYVSPTFADGKLYVTSDQRGVYVLNATNGAKLSFFATGSNSWSSPTLYEGRLYVGSNDWNVYCLAERPFLNSSLTLKLNEARVTLGESISGSGILVPGMADAPVVLSLIAPNGSASDLEATTSDRGVFAFSLTPDSVGNWAVLGKWQSDKGYYDSAYSQSISVEVVEEYSPPSDGTEDGGNDLVRFGLIAVIVAGLVIASVLGYVILKRTKKV